MTQSQEVLLSDLVDYRVVHKADGESGGFATSRAHFFYEIVRYFAVAAAALVLIGLVHAGSLSN